jgi:hypothetical protein
MHLFALKPKLQVGEQLYGHLGLLIEVRHTYFVRSSLAMSCNKQCNKPEDRWT